MSVLITKVYNALKASHPEDATALLLGLLVDGKIAAVAVDPINDDHEIRLHSMYWKSRTAEQVEEIFSKGNGIFPERMRSGTLDFLMNIFIPGWTLDLLPAEASTPQTATGGKRGPRPAIDWSVVWTGATFLISQSEKPENLEDLVRETSSWCDEHFGDGASPGDTALKEAFSGLFKLIAGAAPAKVFPKGARPKRNRKRVSAKKKGAGR
jgi:hypothetical protein